MTTRTTAMQEIEREVAHLANVPPAGLTPAELCKVTIASAFKYARARRNHSLEQLKHGLSGLDIDTYASAQAEMDVFETIADYITRIDDADSGMTANLALIDIDALVERAADVSMRIWGNQFIGPCARHTAVAWHAIWQGPFSSGLGPKFKAAFAKKGDAD